MEEHTKEFAEKLAPIDMKNTNTNDKDDQYNTNKSDIGTCLEVLTNNNPEGVLSMLDRELLPDKPKHKR